MRRPGWRAVGWLDSADALLGIAYGYTGGPGQWWFEEVRRGLRARRPEAQRWLDDYFELTELHVRPDAQGHGLGEGLLRALLAGTDRPGAAVHPGVRRPAAGPRLAALPAPRLPDVLRDHRFTGDSRPFAVLGRPLPLPPAAS